ncbi:hypothetical protein HK098_002214 [Nowakowskiella sp. JEL0407]|nr:hypothetical protein HK098_002214 [Nowakowskiella sp. JEL0407]
MNNQRPANPPTLTPGARTPLPPRGASLNPASLPNNVQNTQKPNEPNNFMAGVSNFASTFFFNQSPPPQEKSLTSPSVSTRSVSPISVEPPTPQTQQFEENKPYYPPEMHDESSARPRKLSNSSMNAPPETFTEAQRLEMLGDKNMTPQKPFLDNLVTRNYSDDGNAKYSSQYENFNPQIPVGMNSVGNTKGSGISPAYENPTPGDNSSMLTSKLVGEPMGLNSVEVRPISGNPSIRKLENVMQEIKPSKSAEMNQQVQQQHSQSSLPIVNESRMNSGSSGNSQQYPGNTSNIGPEDPFSDKHAGDAAATPPAFPPKTSKQKSSDDPFGDKNKIQSIPITSGEIPAYKPRKSQSKDEKLEHDPYANLGMLDNKTAAVGGPNVINARPPLPVFQPNVPMNPNNISSVNAQPLIPELSKEEQLRQLKSQVAMLKAERDEKKRNNKTEIAEVAELEEQANTFLQLLNMPPFTVNQPLPALKEYMDASNVHIQDKLFYAWETGVRSLFHDLRPEIEQMIDLKPLVEKSSSDSEGSDDEQDEVDENERIFRSVDFEALKNAADNAETTLNQVNETLAEKVAIVNTRNLLLKSLQQNRTSETTDRVNNERNAELQMAEVERRRPGHDRFQNVRDEAEAEVLELTDKLALMLENEKADLENIEKFKKEYKDLLAVKKKLKKKQKQLAKAIDPVLGGSLQVIQLLYAKCVQEQNDLEEARAVLSEFIHALE